MGYEIFDDLCKRNNVKPATVSKATGVSTATLTAWKKGEYQPKPDKLQKIADYFGVSLDYMIKGIAAEYYFDETTAQIAQRLYQNKELHMLFDATKDASAEELKNFYDMIMIMKRRERGE